jgi:CHAT domain-containing protein
MAGVTLRKMQRRLRRAEYHVLHFIGHGGFDARIGEGVLAFEDDAGHSQLVRTSHLGTVLADHSTLRLAVLNLNPPLGCVTGSRS